jgi:sortase B
MFVVSVIIIGVCSVLIITNTKNEKIEITLTCENEPDRVLNNSFTLTLDSPQLPALAQSVNTQILPQWQQLHQHNSDFVGWLRLGDTVIDYPVVQYTDNIYYLNRDFNRNQHLYGTLFIDWHTPVVDSRRPDNTVIYGHNMNSGAKFAHLMRYYTPRFGLDAYINNPTIDFSTIYDNDRNTYKIFAAMFVNTCPTHGEVFNYFRQRFFNSSDEFFDFIGKVMDRSVFYTEVDLQYGDEIMTLSTCYFPLGNDTDRFVVFARRLRVGEDPAVDTSTAYINPDPLYFDYYYRVRGGSWGGRNWDASLVKSERKE